MRLIKGEFQALLRSADREGELAGAKRPRRLAAVLPQKRQRCKTVELVQPVHGRTLSRWQDRIHAQGSEPKNIEWRFLRAEPPFFTLNGLRSCVLRSTLEHPIIGLFLTSF
jgi:hypothetical protein